MSEDRDRLIVDRIDPEQEAYQRAKRPGLYAPASERGELVNEIADATEEWDAIQNSVTRETWEGTRDEHLADALIAAGFCRRPYVSVAQIDIAAKAMSDLFCGWWRPGARTTPFMAELWEKQARAAARAFDMIVVEDGA